MHAVAVLPVTLPYCISTVFNGFYTSKHNRPRTCSQLIHFDLQTIVFQSHHTMLSSGQCPRSANMSSSQPQSKSSQEASCAWHTLHASTAEPLQAGLQISRQHQQRIPTHGYLQTSAATCASTLHA